MKRLKDHPFMALFLPTFALFLSYFGLLSWSDFSDDDAHVAQLALSYSWLEPYYSPPVYQQLSIVHFTPLVLSIYKALLLTFGVDNGAFITLQLTMIAIVATLAAYFCQRITQKYTAGLLCLLLIFSNASLLPMLSRFYTIHYLLGAALSLASALLVYRAWQQGKLHKISVLALLLLLSFLALLAKEIYIVTIPLYWLLFLKLRAWRAFSVVSLAFVSYFLLRFHILGASVQGRDGQSFLVALLAIDISTWLNFLIWYITTKWLICSAAVVAFILSPKKMLAYFLIVILFAAPSLAAPHAFQNPALHGDRLFFMFDNALAIASVLAIYARTVTVLVMSSFLILAFVILIPVQWAALNAFSEEQQDTVAHKINRQITSLPKVDSVVFTPLNYQQGEFMNIYRLLGTPWLKIVQNCHQALLYSDSIVLIAFDSTGEKMSRASLQERCLLSSDTAIVEQIPTFDSGLLSWKFSVPAGYTGGVLFVDRAIAVATGVFQQRIVRPKPNERYQIYINKGNHWWFSTVEKIKVHN